LLNSIIKFDNLNSDQNAVISDLDEYKAIPASAYDPEDMYASMISTPNSLKVISQNIRSITCNFDNFTTLLTRINVEWDLLILTECWLPLTKSLPHLDGYNSFATSTNLTQNEGVVVY
jgi:hypothetical protein